MFKRFWKWFTSSSPHPNAVDRLRFLFCQIANEIALGSDRSSGVKPYYYEVMDSSPSLKRVHVQVQNGPIFGIHNGNDWVRESGYDFNFIPLGWNGQTEVAYYSLQIRKP